jgi:hypothetical protein
LRPTNPLQLTKLGPFRPNHLINLLNEKMALMSHLSLYFCNSEGLFDHDLGAGFFQLLPGVLGGILAYTGKNLGTARFGKGLGFA